MQEETLYQKARDGEVGASNCLGWGQTAGVGAPRHRETALTPLVRAGTPFVDILKKNGVQPGIKVDTGLQVNSTLLSRLRTFGCRTVAGVARGFSDPAAAAGAAAWCMPAQWP